jgi:DNA-binding CsgD family transcriptional regulator
MAVTRRGAGVWLTGGVNGMLIRRLLVFVGPDRGVVMYMSDFGKNSARALPPALLLSAGELRTAQMFAAGHTYSEIADALTLSRYTVRNQLSAAYRKLEVHSKLEMARVIDPAMKGAAYL